MWDVCAVMNARCVCRPRDVCDDHDVPALTWMRDSCAILNVRCVCRAWWTSPDLNVRRVCCSEWEMLCRPMYKPWPGCEMLVLFWVWDVCADNDVPALAWMWDVCAVINARCVCRPRCSSPDLNEEFLCRSEFEMCVPSLMYQPWPECEMCVPFWRRDACADRCTNPDMNMRSVSHSECETYVPIPMYLSWTWTWDAWPIYQSWPECEVRVPTLNHQPWPECEMRVQTDVPAHACDDRCTSPDLNVCVWRPRSTSHDLNERFLCRSECETCVPIPMYQHELSRRWSQPTTYETLSCLWCPINNINIIHSWPYLSQLEFGNHDWSWLIAKNHHVKMKHFSWSFDDYWWYFMIKTGDLSWLIMIYQDWSWQITIQFGEVI